MYDMYSQYNNHFLPLRFYFYELTQAEDSHAIIWDFQGQLFLLSTRHD